MKLYDLKMKGEDLKCEIWAYMDDNKIEHKAVKESMNELLDLIYELDPEETE